MITIGARLKQLRKCEPGLTLQDLGDEIDKSTGYLSDIERNRTKPSVGTCQDLANYYGMTLSQLLYGVDVWHTEGNYSHEHIGAASRVFGKA